MTARVTRLDAWRRSAPRHVGPPTGGAGLLGLLLLPVVAALVAGALYAQAVRALVWRR